MHLGAKQSAVEKRSSVQRLKLDCVVIVSHRPEIVVKIISEERPVDEISRKLRLQLYCLIHVGECLCEIFR